ncbi:MAG TPA: type III pantothenate kinase [Solimonas sp.]|nr:type III pantothenate kinase [Solimonas sp.]
MMLLLDVGNSRIKPALWDGTHLHAHPALAHGGQPAAALEAVPAMAPAAVWIASVTGAAHEQQLDASIRRRFGVAPRFARTEQARDGLRVAYSDPARLGVDRWLMMLALWRELRGPFGVAAAGTALTFDAVDAGGQHLGGFIAAGLAAQSQAVLGATRFPTRSLDAPYAEGLGADTEACVRQGALFAGAGALERAARRHANGPRFLCGGDAELLLPHLDQPWTLRPQLVLEGLLACAQGA